MISTFHYKNFPLIMIAVNRKIKLSTSGLLSPQTKIITNE